MIRTGLGFVCRGILCETQAMPKHVKKADLPSKDCAACGRPFLWRKKWAKVWEEVRFCSDKCRTKRG
jgi:hypothetical protein